jgi:hypothetical protein
MPGMNTVVVRWADSEEERGRALYAELLAAALDDARARVGRPVRLLLDADWPGWEEDEAALRSDGWEAAIERGRVLRVLPASRLDATISSETADAAWIAARFAAAWTDERSPFHLRARAFAAGAASSAPLFESHVDGFTTYAVFTALDDAAARFGERARAVAPVRALDVSVELSAE